MVNTVFNCERPRGKIMMLYVFVDSYFDPLSVFCVVEQVDDGRTMRAGGLREARHGCDASGRGGNGACVRLSVRLCSYCEDQQHSPRARRLQRLRGS